MYTSLVPLLVDGVAEALKRTSARLVYVANLVNARPAPDPNDTVGVARSYIRHDSDKLARALMRYYFSG